METKQDFFLKQLKAHGGEATTYEMIKLLLENEKIDPMFDNERCFYMLCATDDNNDNNTDNNEDNNRCLNLFLKDARVQKYIKSKMKK